MLERKEEGKEEEDKRASRLRVDGKLEKANGDLVRRNVEEAEVDVIEDNVGIGKRLVKSVDVIVVEH